MRAVWAAVLFVPLLVVVPLGEAAAQSLPEVMFSDWRYVVASEGDGTVSLSLTLDAPAPSGGLTVSYALDSDIGPKRLFG